MPYCYFAVKAELNRAVTKALDESKYEVINTIDTNNLVVDLTPMFTKDQFADKTQVWFRLSKGRITVLKLDSYQPNIKIPIDENLMLYSGNVSIKDGAVYRPDSIGHLTYTAINASTNDW